MLEGFAAWLLRTYVGEYVENLNTEQLAIGYGGIELYNLRLKKSALQGLELPVEVKSGHIGHLKLEIPFRNPKSLPWIICIDKLFIVASNQQKSKFDGEELKDYQNREKQKLLDAFENRWKANRQQVPQGWWSESWLPSIYSSFSSTVLENLQLIITDVHIRYEEGDDDDDQKSFAFGVTIGRLAAQSTRSDWAPQFLHSDDLLKYKLVELEELAIYWNCSDEHFGGLGPEELQDALASSNNDQQRQYILKPVSASAKVTRNSSSLPLTLGDGPRFVIDLTLGKIPISLSNRQYVDILSFVDDFQRYFMARKYLQWRPSVSVRGNARLWWKFAITCHLEPIREKNRRRTMSFLLERIHDIILYVKAYADHLKNPNPRLELEKVRSAIEDKLTFEELRCLRTIVTGGLSRVDVIPQPTSAQEQPSKSWGGWIQGWTGWSSEVPPPDSNAAAGEFSKAVHFDGPTTQEEEELLDELTEGQHDDSIFSRDQVFAQLLFTLDGGAFTLIGSDSQHDCAAKQLVEFEFSRVEWKSEVRPKHSSWDLVLTLSAVYMRDLLDTTSLFPVLVEPQEIKKDSHHAMQNVSSGLGCLLRPTLPLLEVSYEQRRLSGRSAKRLTVKMQPLKVIYKPDMINKLGRFFRESDETRYRLQINAIESQLQTMAFDRYEQLKTLTKTEFAHAIDNLMRGEAVSHSGPTWDMQLEISAPMIIMPENFHGKDAPMVVFNLGHLSFVNAPSLERQHQRSMASLNDDQIDGNSDSDEEAFETPCSTPPNQDELNEMLASSTFDNDTELSLSIKHKFYERYNIAFSDVQVVVCNLSNDWQSILKRGSSKFHLLDKFSISMQLERRLVFTADSNWPNLTVAASLPKMMMHVDEHKLHVLFKCISQAKGANRPIPADAPPPGFNTALSVDASHEFIESNASNVDNVLQLKATELLVESRIVLSQLTFDQISLSLHSRGRCIAELRFEGVEVEYTQRPFDYSVVFVLRSVMLIDAIQTFGREFELLVASHYPSSEAASHSGIHDKSDALIHITYQNISPDCPGVTSSSTQALRVANLRFNCLHVTANQETIVELINVINQVIANSNISSTESHAVPPDKTDEEVHHNTVPTGNKVSHGHVHLEATFDSLQLTLVRGQTIGQRKVGRKVALVTISDLELVATIQQERSIKGSLGGLHVVSLLPDTTLHRCILSIGHCRTSDIPQRLPDVPLADQVQAFLFTFAETRDVAMALESGDIEINLQVASAFYLHDVAFLIELRLCAGDFQHYAEAMARSLQAAAADMAKSLVTTRRPHDETNGRSGTHMASFLSLDDTDLIIDADDLARSQSLAIERHPKMHFYLRLDVDSPVVVVPQTADSSTLLVGHLGQISFRNSYVNEHLTLNDDISYSNHGNEEIDRVHLNIHDMKLTSMVLSDTAVASLRNQESNTFSLISSSQIEQWTAHLVHILHDTSVKLVVDRSSDVGVDGRRPLITVNCRIPECLRVRLSTSTYKQLLITLDNNVTKSDGQSKSTNDQSTSNYASDFPATLPADQNEHPLNLASDGESSHMSVSAAFAVPAVEVELIGELSLRECGFACVVLKDLSLSYTKQMAFGSEVVATLGYLAVKDLLHTDSDTYGYLLRSSSARTKPRKDAAAPASRFSSSCPEESSFGLFTNLSASLPTVFHSSPLKSSQGPEFRPMLVTREKICQQRQHDSEINADNDIDKVDADNNALVTICIATHVSHDSDSGDNDSPLANKAITKSIDIDFSSLDITLNLQTWVVMLEFFGIGSPMPLSPKPTVSRENNAEGHDVTMTTESMSQSHVAAETPPSRTDVKVAMASLSLTLNKEQYPLAKAHVADLACTASLDRGNQNVSGRIGKLELVDMSPSGQIYFERFLTSPGNEALSFKLFRFGEPDPDLLRSYNISLQLTMSSVYYVHTQRFLTEVVAFCQHFLQLQEVLGRMRAVSHGDEVFIPSNRAARVLLNIEADTPVLIIPQSSGVCDVLAGYLGRLSVSNNFIWSHSDEAISSKVLANRFRKTTHAASPESALNVSANRLLDRMTVTLHDMEVFSARYAGQSKDGVPSLERQGGRLMKETCKLNLTVERNLEWAFGRDVPDITVAGSLSSVYIDLDLSQFGLIMNMLGDNLGEQLEPFQRPSGYLVDPVEQASPTDEVWTTLSITLELVNVSIRMLPQFSFGPMINLSHAQHQSLGQLDFVSSRFIYASYSDGSKALDLVSNVVLLHDERSHGTEDIGNSQLNVFTRVVEPSVRSQGPDDCGLQFEVHYLDTLHHSLLTFLLNRSKIILIFDFLLEVFRFITRKEEKEFKDKQHKEPSVEDSVLYSDASSEILLPSGVVTKATASPSKSKADRTFELKVNVADTELVVVEDACCRDTRAIILKTTAVVAWRPDHTSERPLSCSLQSLEVFSCVLVDVDSTALSIIDPVSLLVELNPDPKPNAQLSIGLLHVIKPLPTLEIHSHSNFNIRLSYNDVLMFVRIIEAVKRQVASVVSLHAPERDNDVISRLMLAGYSREDCKRAIEKANGNEASALEQLSKEASPSPLATSDDGKQSLAGFLVRAQAICVCVIDDCGNNDIPLVELILNGVNFHHELQHACRGSAHASVMAEYYNRSVSGWEPLVERWKCHIHWQKISEAAAKAIKTAIKIDAPDRLDINVTSAFLAMTRLTLTNWTADYYERDAIAPAAKRRAPFVPFVLRNKTGCCIRFGTLTTSPQKAVTTSYSSSNLHAGQRRSSGSRDERPPFAWHEVTVDADVAFRFDSRDKLRHKETHHMKVHQIAIQVDGWLPTTPVSVDQVGLFFRHVSLTSDGDPLGVKATSIRVVFDVALEGARKVITIRSSLTFINCLAVPIQLKAESTVADLEETLVVLAPNEAYAVPLNVVMWKVFARPVLESSPLDYCRLPLAWHDVTRRFEEVSLFRQCSDHTAGTNFRFCCVVRREGYPDVRSARLHDARRQAYFMPPGHSLFIKYQIVLFNLLPVDLFYSLESRRQRIEPGHYLPLNNVDVTVPIDLGLSFENYPHFENVKIFSKYRQDPVVIPIRFRDVNSRPLIIYVKLERDMGTVKLSVYAPYWLINKTGLPLIFRREGENEEVAGQLSEHEKARSRSPLLFSYIDREASFRCQMRIGNELDGQRALVPIWSNPFSLEDANSLTLYVKKGHNQPEGAYEIGVEACQGEGLFGCSRMVSFVTRYQLENHTQHALVYAQRHIVKAQACRNPEGSLVGLPGAVTLYHWSRGDLDQLLCIRLSDVDHCRWSGGFRVDSEDSFHVNMRSMFSGACLLLRVEVLLQGATYFVTFNDAAQWPPPFRIDNMAEVDVTFYQEQCSASDKELTVKANQSFPYALDEPSLPAHVTVSVFKETSATYDMLASKQNLASLFYQNSIYLAFTHTFERDDFNQCCHGESPASDDSLCQRHLVLDVMQDKYVIVNKKVPHKRSQFWRMTSVGELEHVGSCAPRDPRQQSPSVTKRGFVLDIESVSTLKSNQRVGRLVISRPDPQRFATQKWFFEDGFLKCGLSNLVVQPQGGMVNFKAGCNAVVSEIMTRDTPPDQCLTRQKLRPGSGVLNISVHADGPTRVLQITDMHKQCVDESDWMTVDKQQNPHLRALKDDVAPNDTEVEVTVSLVEGVGISLVNSVPEEIVFASLSHIDIEVLDSSRRQAISATIGSVQIDNQLFGTQLPVLLYQTPASSSSVTSRSDLRAPTAVQLAIEREKSTDFNVQILRRFAFSVCKLNLQLEERVLLKLLQFFGFGGDKDKSGTAELIEANRPSAIYGNQRIGLRDGTSASNRVYCEELHINGTQLRTSLSAGGKLPSDLMRVKRAIGIPIVSLEDAIVVLGPFHRKHLFERRSNVSQQMVRHYKDAVIGQAASVLGSLDILGNPMGLLHDVSAGVEGLVKKGNLGGLFVNVAHGLSDTAAKMTGTIADGLWSASMDNKFQESRDAMRVDKASSSSDHLVAGFKGLGMGLFGGLTSIVTQPIDGASRKGVTGLISGIGKGLVGTVAKPAAGILDLASGAAAAVRGSARTRSRVPHPMRLKRNCYGSGGLLTPYSRFKAEGQDVLLRFNEGNSNERFVLSEAIRSGSEDSLRAIITTDGVYFANSKQSPSPEGVIFHVDYMQLYECSHLQADNKEYVELIMCKESAHGNLVPSRTPGSRPRVRCDSSQVAKKIAQEINYMKNLFEEKQMRVVTEQDTV